MMIVRAARSMLAGATGNATGQSLLRLSARVANYLMGVGAGADVGDSGELAVLALVMRSFPNDRLVIFDVGANVGTYAASASGRLRGRDAHIHCFEPSVVAFEKLEGNLTRLGQIRANNYALGEVAGSRTLYADRPGSGLASLTERHLDYLGIQFGHTETVRVSTVDAYCAEHGIERIHLLKMDVEGHELDVLKGARRMLAERRVDVLTFEFGGCNIQTRTYLLDFWRLLQGHDFALARITPSGYLAPMERYREADEQFITTNFVAMSKRVAGK